MNVHNLLKTINEAVGINQYRGKYKVEWDDEELESKEVGFDYFVPSNGFTEGDVEMVKKLEPNQSAQGANGKATITRIDENAQPDFEKKDDLIHDTEKKDIKYLIKSIEEALAIAEGSEENKDEVIKEIIADIRAEKDVSYGEMGYLADHQEDVKRLFPGEPDAWEAAGIPEEEYRETFKNEALDDESADLIFSDLDKAIETYKMDANREMAFEEVFDKLVEVSLEDAVEIIATFYGKEFTPEEIKQKFGIQESVKPKRLARKRK